MKALGILLVSATLLLAGCACDCNDKVGKNGFKVDGTEGTVGNTDGTDADGYTTNNGTATGTNSGNTSTDGNDASASSSADKTKAQDPRTYGTSGGGVGYRTDTIDEYKGVDGSARDKGDLDKVPNPK